MPRKTSLTLISERAVADPGVESATAALEAATPGYSLAPPQDILNQLRRQNEQLTGLVAETTQRAQSAEAALHETMTAAAGEREQAARAAAAEVEKIRTQAQAAVKNAMAQGAVAEKAATAATQVRQTAGMLAQLLSFLVDRAPVLATLAGAYLLARDMLPAPGAMQLGLLGIYGAVGVAPAVWWSLRGK